ncbi:hypothetical protein MMC11_004034 [Xylographa trunciseda]|nr:hypothetical protein [Xylographa trunciseda]
MSPAYAVAIMVLSEGLSPDAAMKALNVNGLPLGDPPAGEQLFMHLVQTVTEKNADFHHYVESNSDEPSGKDVLLFLQQGGLVYMDLYWMQQQSVLDLNDGTLQAAYDAILHCACHGNHTLERNDF